MFRVQELTAYDVIQVNVEGVKRRAMEKDRKHPPGSATCLDAQRASDRADKEQEKLKGKLRPNFSGSRYISSK